MSWGWQTTDEDVREVLRLNGIDITYDDAEKLLRKLDHVAIEKAALRGEDMDEQTEAAAKEIWRQLQKIMSR